MNDKEYEALLERANEEYEELLNQKDTLNLKSKSEIENWAYELTHKKDFLEMIENKNLSNTTFDVLKETKTPLYDIYDEWLGKDDDFFEQKKDMIDDSYYRIARIIKQRKIGELLNRADFNENQKEEIERGFDDGLTVEQVEVYAKKEFDNIQMKRIREDLQKGTSIEEVKDIYSIWNENLPYEDAFFIDKRNETVKWIYYNPDSNSGGQFVENVLSFEDIKKAAEEKDFFDYLSQVAKQHLYDKGEEEFLNIKEEFLSEPGLTGCTEETISSLIKTVQIQEKLQPFLNNEKLFEYQGYHFLPIRKFRKNEGDFYDIVRRFIQDRNLGLSTYKEWQKRPYNYDEFYKASTDKNCDIFFCIETERQYVPGNNELYAYDTKKLSIEDVKEKYCKEDKQTNKKGKQIEFTKSNNSDFSPFNKNEERSITNKMKI